MPMVSTITVTVGELADRFGATVVGDRSQIIQGVAGIEEAPAGHITFVSNPRYKRKLFSTKASAAIVPPDITDVPITVLVSDNPYLTFAKVLEFFHPKEVCTPAISSQAWIAEKAVVEGDCTIFPFVYIGENARIG